jgi:hypothetical protein
MRLQAKMIDFMSIMTFGMLAVLVMLIAAAILL